MEQHVLKWMNAETITNAGEKINGGKNMVELSTTSTHNRKAQKCVQCVFGRTVEVSTQSKLFEQNVKEWRRNKGEFFVHLKTKSNDKYTVTETTKA